MEILQRALREALDRNAAETVRWTQYKEQHEGAKANIEEFKKSLEVDIMVPIGTKALIPGRLYHTNEIVVSHSGTYYSKCSAHKALEICQKRLNVAADRLKALEAEANMHRNQLELPVDFDAFSSQEIIETYNEDEERQWQVDHKKKMKEHKRKEAVERQNAMNGNAEDDIVKRLEELELMEELENELEAISDEDDEAIQAILKESVSRQTSLKKRTSHFDESMDKETSEKVEEQVNERVNVSQSVERSGENSETDSISSNSSDDDDEDDDEDDIPAEFKKIELKAASLTNKEKLKLFKAEMEAVQDYLQNFRPRTIEEISHKTDKMFLSDHLLGAIETIEDELNCEQYLNGENVVNEEPHSDELPVNQIGGCRRGKTILKKKKKISFAAENEVKSFDSRDEPSKLFDRKIQFALEDEVKMFDVEEAPRKISTTILFDHGPVLNLSINHSDAVFTETGEKTDVIRSPVDIYKEFAACTLNQSNEKHTSSAVPKRESKSVSNRPSSQEIKKPPLSEEVKQRPLPKEVNQQQLPQESKAQPNEKDVVGAKTEVKEMLDNMFGPKNANEPDPLPDGNFVDAHEPKKRVSLFKQRRQMKSQ